MSKHPNLAQGHLSAPAATGGPDVPDTISPPPEEYPPIYVTTEDRARLLAVLSADGAHTRRSIRLALTRKLWQATICATHTIPANVITMHSRVIFRRNVGESLEQRRLCFSESDRTVPIMTSLGTAMLGLSAGSVVPYENSDGTRLLLVIENILYQPEADGRDAVRDRARSGRYRRAI